ncbi:two-component system, chemotaxis family, response regulator CheY/two-component system, NarL family, capsular synthesis sensor histidine kinase RcsC [Terriglobus roseus]|uniref:Two-component system, chemotaxis family, response regulator CheY/two-component system, NarL family, capsular synthesis sensor histidine kinase RcsC n=2 Tax=Terriglobus roseus TaxID=392734 RepID=A0A1H4T4F7_9BACT|nr:two-component system, chemotaxis family, response regulator CheY/two-component system, NarL family, capsular synthesis sensor histidine kinase RcsC [Terriglobus roseus]
MTLSDSTILVVDDEPVLRLTFSLVLQQTGATVHVAEHGLDALLVLERERIDVILSDKQMPHMDGLTLIQTLRERGITAPVVFFVNGVASENPAEMERLGVTEMITKPLHPAELVKVLTRVVANIPSDTQAA